AGFHGNGCWRVEIWLLPRVDGKPPPPALWVPAGQPIGSVLLDDVLEARRPAAEGPEKSLDLFVGATDAAIGAELDRLVNLLRTVAADALDDIVTPIDDAEAVIRDRIRRSPQRTTIWLPDSAPQAERDRAARDLRAATPSE